MPHDDVGIIYVSRVYLSIRTADVSAAARKDLRRVTAQDESCANLERCIYGRLVRSNVIKIDDAVLVCCVLAYARGF